MLSLYGLANCYKMLGEAINYPEGAHHLHISTNLLFALNFVQSFGRVPIYNKDPATLRAVYKCDFAGCDCRPGVCNKLAQVYEARYPLMIGSSLLSTLSSVKHILQDVNRKAQSRSCKQPFSSPNSPWRGSCYEVLFYTIPH